MKLFKSIINGICYGITGGFLTSIVFLKLYGVSTYLPSSPLWVYKFPTPLDAVITSTLLWSFIGILYTLSFNILKMTSISFFKSIIYHFIITLPLVSSIALLAGWFPLNLYFIFHFFIEAFMIYLILWIIFYFKMKRSLKFKKK